MVCHHCTLHNSCKRSFKPCAGQRDEIGVDVEPVDQKKYLEDSCKPKCAKPFVDYQACIKRVKDDETGEKHCTGQYFDYWFCVDHCVAPSLLGKLK